MKEVWVRHRPGIEQPGGGQRWGQQKGAEGPLARWLQRPWGSPFVSTPHSVLFVAFIFCLPPYFLSLLWVSSSSFSSQLFHLPNKAIHAGGQRPVVSPPLLSILPVLKSDSISAAALGLQLLPGLDVGHKDPDLGFPTPASLLRAVEQACFTSHPGWRRARMPSLEIAFLPESNGFLSATVPLV